MNGVAVVGINDLSFRRGQDYVALVHGLKGKRLLFMTECRKHATVIDFKADLIEHGGGPDDKRRAPGKREISLGSKLATSVHAR